MDPSRPTNQADRRSSRPEPLPAYAAQLRAAVLALLVACERACVDWRWELARAAGFESQAARLSQAPQLCDDEVSLRDVFILAVLCERVGVDWVIVLCGQLTERGASVAGLVDDLVTARGTMAVA